MLFITCIICTPFSLFWTPKVLYAISRKGSLKGERELPDKEKRADNVPLKAGKFAYQSVRF